MRKRIPRECVFTGRGAGECVGCPKLDCKHMRLPFQDPEETAQIALGAAMLVKSGRVRGYRPAEPVEKLAVALQAGLFTRMREFRLQQALDAVKLGLASVAEAAKYAGVRKQDFYGRVSGPKTRAA